MPRTRFSPKQLQGVEILMDTVNVNATSANSVESDALATFTIPANSLGPKGYIRWEALCSYPNSSATKTMTVKVNGVVVTGPTATTTVSYRWFGRLVNRNTTEQQIMGGSGGSITGVNYGNGSGVVQEFTFDTTQDVVITIHVKSTSTTAESIEFEYFNLYICYNT